MKKLLLLSLNLLCLLSLAQTYPSQNINLLSLINPNSGTVGVGTDGRKYSGVWGWKQTSTNKEYAIAGSSIGTYFIDVTNPTTPSVSAFVPGKQGCTWREIKTYQNYCYISSDDPSPNTFQIIDMSALPATVTVVHDGTTYFERGHTVWVDQDKLYVGATTYSTGAFSDMNVYSLATPTAPVLLRSLAQDYPNISYVHDMYVRNDTVYASCGNQGLYVFKFNTGSNTFTQLGSYSGYPGAGYNHSSMLTQDGKTLVFCDEYPPGLPIKVVNVQNLSNIQPVQTYSPHPATTPHNPYVIGNQWAVISCYQDGLFIYDISQTSFPWIAGYFDTYPQGGFNVSDYSTTAYRGNWGAYPYLPSGIIIAGDMQNGIFILDATPAFANPAGIKKHAATTNDFIFYPNPASERIAMHFNTESNSLISVKNIVGQPVYEKEFRGEIHEYLDLKNIENGTYVITIKNNDQVLSKKLVVNH